MNLPKARTDLLIQDLNDEVLIYDKNTNKSYYLNSTARTVFNACNGKKMFSELNLPEDIVYLALDELKKQKLIQSDLASPFAGMNRREVIRKIGLASMIALPVIVAFTVPAAANAASVCVSPTGRPNGSDCMQSCQCGSGCCRNMTINQGGIQPIDTCQTQVEGSGPACYGGGNFAL